MSPMPEEVLAHAIECVKAIEPAAVVEQKGDTGLMIHAEGRSVLWNLADPMRLAPEDEQWREGVATLAKRVFEHFRAPPVTMPAVMAPENVVVLVWPAVKLDELEFEVVCEKLVDGLVLFYGVRSQGQIRSIRPAELEASGLSLSSLREHAVRNTGADAEKLDFAPLQPGREVFTNQGHSPVAASVLADTRFWTKLASTMGPLLVAVPSPSRVFLAPDDAKHLVVLRGLIQQALEVEEEILTTSILRFERDEWAAVPLAN